MNFKKTMHPVTYTSKPLALVLASLTLHGALPPYHYKASHAVPTYCATFTQGFDGFLLVLLGLTFMSAVHDDVITWKHFPRYWPFVGGIHRSQGHPPPPPPPHTHTHKRQRRVALMFSLICAWINLCINNRDAGDLRRNRAHYDVTEMGWVQPDTESFPNKAGSSIIYFTCILGPVKKALVSNSFPCVRISVITIRQSWYGLFFIIGILILII